MSAFERLEAGLLAHVDTLADNRPAVADAEAGGGAAPGQASPRRRRLWLMGATGSLAAGAVAVAAVLPSSGPAPARVLSPQEAVAAAVVSLDSDGILEWTDVQGDAVQDPTKPGFTVTRWDDLRTHDHSEFHRDVYDHPTRGTKVVLARVWHVGRTSWFDEGQVSKKTGKRIVRKHVVDRPPVEERYLRTPVDRVRKDLARAAAGKLPMRDGGKIDGIATVEILDERKGFSRRIWISKEASPRLLKSRYRVALPDGMRGEATVGESKTLVWKIHPRTPQYLAKVGAPTFDPAKYTVVTTHRK